MSTVDHYRRRFLEDMLCSASEVQMLRRAEVFDWASPRPDDFNGRATAADLAARAERCRGVAAAYRAKAAVLRRYGLPDFIAAELGEVLGEVA